MKNLRKKILILDGISSQALSLMRSFYKSGHYVTILCPHKANAGYFSRYSHEKLIFGSLYNNPESAYVWLLNYLKNNPTDLVLGLSDKTAKLLSKHKNEITAFTKVIVPDFRIFSVASDKFKTMQFCMENKIPCPFTIDGNNENILNIESKIPFPVIVKPKQGVGAVGVRKYMNPLELKRDYDYLKTTYGPLVFQEYIPNEEQYTVEAFCDAQSKVKACVIILKSRFFPASGGTSSCNITVENKNITTLVSNFLEKVHWIGSANIDLIYDPRDNTFKIIEINPRVGAIIKIAFASGVDIAKMQLELAFNSVVEGQYHYKKEIVLRNLMLDILWFFTTTQQNRRNTKPSFFKFFDSMVYYQTSSKDDPFTCIGFILGNIIKYANLHNLKRKIAFSNPTHYRGGKIKISPNKIIE